jgi:hypothetical protein
MENEPLPSLMQSAAGAFGAKLAPLNKNVPKSKGWSAVQKHLTVFTQSRRDSKLAYMMAMQNGFGKRALRGNEEVSDWFSDQARRASIGEMDMMGFDSFQEQQEMLSSSGSDSEQEGEENEEEEDEDHMLPREKFWRTMKDSLDHEKKSTEPKETPASRYLRFCLTTHRRPEALMLKLWHSNHGKVDLGGFMIGDSLARSIAASLEAQSHSITPFKYLYLSRNRMTDRGIAPLLQQISCPHHLNSLLTLDLSHNKMKAKSVDLVCKILAETKVSGLLIDFIDSLDEGEWAINKLNRLVRRR